MIYLDEATKDWKTDGTWKIAPAGLDWIEEGNYVTLGDGVKLGNYVTLGNGAQIKAGTEAIDLGWADGYRKCIAQVDGVAYIGAGCRWFTLADALKHWDDKDDRVLTMCLMQSAIYIAGYKGWSHE